MAQQRVLTSSYDATTGRLFRRGASEVPEEPDPGAGRTYLLNIPDFNSQALGTLTVTRFNQIFGGGGDPNQVGNFAIAADPVNGGQCLQLTLQGGLQGGGGSSSMVIPLPGGACTDLTMETSFTMVGTDFGKAQKLPGPVIVRPGVSLSYPSGGNQVTDQGASARAMHTDEFGQPRYTGFTYLYASDALAENGYGENLWWTPRPKLLSPFGVKRTLKTRLAFGALGSRTDVVETHWDGVQVYRTATRALRTRADVNVPGIQFHWFFGGNDNTYAPTSDQIIRIHSFQAWKPSV